MGPTRPGAGLIGTGEAARRRAPLAVGVAGAAGLAAWAATTAPFTAGANAVSATGIALVALAVALRWRRAPPPAAIGEPRVTPRRWPWLLLAAIVVAWELACFFLGPRVLHPTISSLYDSATRFEPVRGACFFAWLCAGAALVRA